MRLLRWACAGQKVVQDMETAFSCWDCCDSAPLQSVIQYFSTYKCWIYRGGSIILELEEEASLGGSWGCGSLGRRQGIENIRSEGKLGGERSGRFVEECGQQMGTNGRFTRARFPPKSY